MKLAVRADAGAMIGTGHVMRCLTLADVMRQKGAEVTFICREHPGHLGEMIVARGYSCHLLPVMNTTGDGYASWLGAPSMQDAADTLAVLMETGSADLLIVDHYALDGAWHRALRQQARRIMVIDDLADRTYDADMLLDQNFGRTEDDYSGHVPAVCRVMTGPLYALLRPEFAAARPEALRRRAAFSCVRRVLVSLGGMDQRQHMDQVVRLLAAVQDGRDITTTLVMADETAAERVRTLSRSVNLKVEALVKPDNMAALMAEADVAIGAMGGMAWERCALGLPTLAVILADNQRPAAERMKAAGLLIDAVIPEELTAAALRQALEIKPADYARLSAASAAVCDGAGTGRVVDEILWEAA